MECGMGNSELGNVEWGSRIGECGIRDGQPGMRKVELFKKDTIQDILYIFYYSNENGNLKIPNSDFHIPHSIKPVIMLFMSRARFMITSFKQPLVSIIIPTYNRGWILKDAIDSVLAQDYEDFELIVVDDGSTDTTPQILESFGQEIIVLRQANKGVSAARNRGIAAANGQLVAFLDSDDIWLPGKLSRQVEFFGSTPDAVIHQTEEIWIRNGVRVNPKRRHRKQSGMIFEPSLKLCLISPSAVMIKKNLFNAVGLFDENLPACEDYDLWLRISCRYPVHLIQTPLIIKRGGHEDQLSKASGLDKFRIQSLEKIISSGRLTESQYRAAIRVLHDKCVIYAGGCCKRGREAEATYYQTLADSLERRIWGEEKQKLGKWEVEKLKAETSKR